MKDMNKNEHSAVLAHPLCITRIDVILRLLAKEKGIKASAVPQIAAALGMALFCALPTALEYLLFRPGLRKVRVKAPVFIVGHWRSGTTLVQYLMAQDKNFGGFDPVFNFAFNFYHLLGWLFRPLVKASLSDKRPQDNMPLSLDLPLEEYMAFAKIEADSLYPVNYFPMSFQRYMDNSYWQDLPAAQRDRLERKYDLMLRKCTAYCRNKRLLLKSPDNTGRVCELYRMYPDAKFVHICRNPYTVIRSTLHLYESIFDMWSLQDIPSREVLEDEVIGNFSRMYREYFAAAKELPPGTLHELRFEDFEKDPVGHLKETYAALGLPGFAEAVPGFEAYLASQKDYQKNRFDYPEGLMKKIDERLGDYFEHYGYEKGIF